MRGQRVELGGGVVLIDDCYNANPMSMRAAIDDLAETAPGRRVAVLGDMLELGASSPELHRELGRHARERGVELLVTVGPLAAQIGPAFGGEAHAVEDAQAAGELAAELLRDGDTVLVKGSRGVGLERVRAVLAERRGSAQGSHALSGGGSGAGRR
jgi:UDP-N-acetylmuramoyl-tripeptide--D-alanyl-D-alanine ligase